MTRYEKRVAIVAEAITAHMLDNHLWTEDSVARVAVDALDGIREWE